VPYFDDGPRADESPRRSEETLWQMFNRSAWKRLARARGHLEQWLDELPAIEREGVLARLEDRDDRNVYAAITELATHALLVRLRRRDVEVSPPTGGGGATDYLLKDAALHLEVHRLSESQDVHSERQQRYQVLAALNKVTTGRFSLTANMKAGRQLPAMKGVVRRVQGWIDSLDPDAERQLLDADPSGYVTPGQVLRAGDWEFRISATPLRAGAPEEEVVGRIIERYRQPATVEAIRRAITSKRRQHRSLIEPLVVVLDLSAGHATDRTISDALYGDIPLVGHDTVSSRRTDHATWEVGRTHDGNTEATPTSRAPVAVLVLDNFNITDPEYATLTLWLRPGEESLLPPGPWKTARWVPGQQYGDDVHFDGATSALSDYCPLT
jgi:hypothetical protein